MLNAIESSARWLKYRLGFRDDSRLVVAVRPAFNKFLSLLYGRQGLVRKLGGVETLRILTAHRNVRDDFERPLFRFLRRSVHAGDTVIEVGANVGVFTVMLARWVGPSGRVFAFEPSPIARSALRSHLAMNGVSRQVSVIPSAISDMAGRATFYEDGSSGQNTLSRTHSRIPEAIGVEVEVTTLDLFCQASGVVPSLVKVDIEGFELHALRGAKQVLKNHKPLMAVEIHPMNWSEVGISRADIDAYLREVGYHAFPIDGLGDPLSEYGHALLMHDAGRASK